MLCTFFFFFPLFFFNDTATTEIYTLSLHDALPIFDILVAKQRISADRVIEGKEKLRSIVNLLTRMIKNLSEDS